MAKDEKEKLNENIEEEGDNDRRDFLKLAGKGALAMALVSAMGNLASDDSEARTVTRTAPQTAVKADLSMAGRSYQNMKLNVAKDTSRKQFGLSGPELGQVLKNEGFIPGNVTNLGNAALHVSVSW